jgi:hypothetical protein
MDFQKAGILLEKINALYKNLSADGGRVSGIEKDLMRAYLQQFYEQFLPVSDSHTETEEHVVVDFPVEVPREKKKVEILKPAVETPPPPPPPPPPAPAPTNKKPLVAEVEEEEEEEETPVIVHKKTEAPDEELENLFEHHQARELSEKLSELPIPDLNKAMGLNERIFTINELFDGDQEAYKQAIQVLNGFHSFDDAKNYLVKEIAIRFNWAHAGKKNKAKNFIKLVRRRYIA